ncbi:MAG TPA: hypothetical protein VNQ77_02685 [Frankiaceae bacterium]|nr:hypothetical protein [Frankiaceae bacterium]
MRRTLAAALLAAASLTAAPAAHAANCAPAGVDVCALRENAKRLVFEAVECGPVFWEPCR